MVIYTSYFGNIKNLPRNLTKISIARFSDKFPDIPRYEPLMPSKGLLYKIKNGIIKEFQYVRSFNAQLANLDLDQVMADLTEIAGENDVVLLCYESPTDFCHRHLVSKWLRDEFIESIEYGSDRIKKSDWMKQLGVTDEDLVGSDDEFDID